MSRSKFTLEERLRILPWIDDGHPTRDAVLKFGVDKTIVIRWRIKLQAYGQKALNGYSSNDHYSVHLKTQSVQEYLAERALEEITVLSVALEEKHSLYMAD